VLLGILLLMLNKLKRLDFVMPNHNYFSKM
jgi:hypothetical protein